MNNTFSQRQQLFFSAKNFQNDAPVFLFSSLHQTIDVNHKSAFNVPTPKDDREDLNQFEIMKGEILSGNDSTELITKFKVMIMKLTHNGRLPKGQAKDLLFSLVELGY